MSDNEQTRKFDGSPIRVLFSIGVTDGFFAAEPDEIGPVKDAIEEAFADLKGRFGVEVLATMDDDRLTVGASETWPWTSYIVADAPDMNAVHEVTNIVRTATVGKYRLWRYLKIEARVGRPLFFGNE